MKQNVSKRFSLKRFVRDERGAAAILLTIYLPFFVGLTTLAVDAAYVQRTRTILQATADAAALAATAQLPDNGACGTAETACTIAKVYAEKNMPQTPYGFVLDNSDVLVGRWTNGCLGGGQSNETCFTLPGQGGSPASCTASTSTWPQCNAVKVTTRMAQSNGNALVLPMAQFVGYPTFDVSATAIAVVGNDQNAPGWNAMIVQDISGSFTSQLPKAIAANQALLDCLNKNAPTGSTLGVTLFTGTSPSTPFISMTGVSNSTDYGLLKKQISNIKACGQNPSPYPQCGTYTSQSAGMQVAYNTFCPYSPCPVAGNAGSKNAMVIVSDGLPQAANCGGAGQPRCNGQNGTPDLEGQAITQANNAAAQGMDIYTIFYSDQTGSQYTNGRNFLAQLRRGNGISLDTPDADQLSSLMGKICTAALQHRLVW